MNLTEHFTLEEFTESREARVWGIDNTPSEDALERLKHTAFWQEAVRDELGVPVLLTSGYRCPELNCITGGTMTLESLQRLIAVSTIEHVLAVAQQRIAEKNFQNSDSQHMRGEADDFIAPRFGRPLMVCRAIEASRIPYDQLIYEYGGWCHISFVAHREPRRQVLTYKRGIKGVIQGLVG